MNSSRIFVRGLPPNLTVEEFRKHFARQSDITDSKFISHRRIGYVGYKSHDEAAKAVKYFNKSFIRMSRIIVELARPIDKYVSIQLSEKSIRNPIPARAENRKPQPLQTDGASTKLQEFLDVMQPPSKSKTWVNEDAGITRIHGASQPDNSTAVASEDLNDEVCEHTPKKRKRSVDHGSMVQASEPNLSAKVTKNNGFAGEVSGKAVVLEEAPQIGEVTVPTSDQDWIRARTSRLLGLVDDEDALMYSAAPIAVEDPKAGELVVSDRSQPRMTSDVGSQTEEETCKVQPEAKPKSDVQEENITTRLFIRNLSYTTSEEELRAHFRSYGTLEDVHLPVDSLSGSSKGFAYVQYVDPEAARQAILNMDGKAFHGRLLHILAASAKKSHALDDYAISKFPIKKQKQIKRKAEAASSIFSWNSMYMNTDAVMSSISDRLGISKSELLDPTSSDAAIKQAHAETHIIQETKAYYAASGVYFDAFKRHDRGDTTILVKNFPYGTKSAELKKLFETYGNITKLLMPPSGTTAIIEFQQATEARSAFGSLAYRKFKDSILFLEKAPKDLFSLSSEHLVEKTDNLVSSVKPLATDLLEKSGTSETVISSTLFVRNLNFSTTTERLQDIFKPLGGFLSARVKTKLDPKKPGQVLSMGFGFLEFRSKQDAQAALVAMDGYKLDGHELLIRASHKVLDAAENRRNEDRAKKQAGRRTKIIIKNLPFEASKADVRSLFGAYGQLRSVRVPKKFDSSTRGFAFADFITAREAENAMDALKDTHLLGRRLVLDFAAEDAVDPEEEIEKMQKKIGRQADKVALQKLTGMGRKKFNVDENDDLDE